MAFYGFFFIGITLQGQSNDWNNETSKSGRIKVSSRITKRFDDKGNKMQVAEYNATVLANVSLEKCIALMKNVSRHKEFLERTEKSQRIKTISANEWIIYYHYSSPWPLPDSDCISKVKMIENERDKTVTFDGKAVPRLYEDKGLRRMTLSDVKYIFKDIENGKVKIMMQVTFTPVITAPDWMLNIWFPEGPAAMLERFIELAKK